MESGALTETDPAVIAAAQSAHGNGHGAHEEFLMHQYEDRAQQDDAYMVGMWAFLVTEIMFFGALFLAYTVYRFLYPEVFYDAHKHLNANYGGFNTFVLLSSSFSMALAVRSAQLRSKKGQLFWMSLTLK